MSRREVFIFVEGVTPDPFIYGKLCQLTCSETRHEYELVSARELPGGTGGKLRLLVFFEYLKRKKSLVDDFKGKKTLSVFYLDKDVDDLTRVKRRSSHIIYTKYYDIENHIFCEGDLGEAAAIAAPMDPTQAKSRFGDYGDWRRNSACTWKDWVTLCVFSKLTKTNFDCTYSSLSRINVPLHGPVDPNQKNVKIAELRSRFTGTAKDFRSTYLRVERKVELLYSRGEYDFVFKGKWYSTLFLEAVKSMAGSQPIVQNGLKERLTTALIATLDFSAPWTTHFRQPLKQLLELL